MIKKLLKMLAFILVVGLLTSMSTACIKYSGEMRYPGDFSKQELTATEIYNEISPSVCEIIAYNKKGEAFSLGTGFAYSRDGRIITNYHVIENAISVKVAFGQKSYITNIVLAYDKDIDIAVLKINATNLIEVDICDETNETGGVVYAIGSSQGLTATLSQGIITYADRVIDGVHYVQHDSAISPGNSGGPLINAYGEVIGINTLTMKDSQNLNFAISISEIGNLDFSCYTSLPKLFGDLFSEPFELLKDYIISKGNYDSTYKRYSYILDSEYIPEYNISYMRIMLYDVDDEEIGIQLLIELEENSYDVLTSIYIDKIDFTYEWVSSTSDNYGMVGILYAEKFNEKALLGYSKYIGDISQRENIREMASSSVNIMCKCLDSDLAPIGLTAEDLGFKYY